VTAGAEVRAGRRWTEYMPLDQLRPNPDNPKRHSIDELRKSMGRWGYVEPVVVDERTGLLVAGHGRRELLLDDLAAGREPPEGVEVADDGGWLVPVNRGWASADDDEAYGYLVASNRLPELGGWHTDLLTEGLRRLAEVDGLAGVGYTAEELEDMLAVLAPPLSLDELAEQVGDSDPSDFWPVLRVRLDPDLYERFNKTTAAAGDDDVARVRWLVETAEKMSVQAS
jgi:hypothetical protein